MMFLAFQGFGRFFCTSALVFLTACGQENASLENRSGSTLSIKLQPTLTTAWVRPTVEGQMATAAYFELNVPVAMTLIGAESSVASTVELHDMVMEGDVMQMRKLKAITLTPQQPLLLKPGGKHLMLMALRSPITENSMVPITLRLKTHNGEELALKIQAKACNQPC